MLDLVAQGAKSRAAQQDGAFGGDSCPKKSGKAKKKIHDSVLRQVTLCLTWGRSGLEPSRWFWEG